jgi:hypothetical protein
MCSICKDILGKKTLKHDIAYCPIAQSSYCGICARYGHTTLHCPDKETIHYRTPVCLEQLIPWTVLDAQGIMSFTPLPTPYVEDEPKYVSVMEVVDTEKNIKAILQNHNKQDRGSIKELRSRLQKLADELQKKLVYLKPIAPVE